MRATKQALAIQIGLYALAALMLASCGIKGDLVRPSDIEEGKIYKRHQKVKDPNNGSF